MSPATLRRSAALAYAVIGVVATVAPARVPAVFGGVAATPAARSEVRAVYAGIPFAFAAALLAAGRPGSERDSGALGLVRDASAGMALARLAGAAAERSLPAWPTGAFAVLEAALAVATHRAGRPRPA